MLRQVPGEYITITTNLLIHVFVIPCSCPYAQMQKFIGFQDDKLKYSDVGE